MAERERLVAVAAGEVGTRESPAGSNRVKYNTWFYGREVSGAGYPWCCAFVCWCFARAGLISLVKRTGGCTTLMNWFKAKGQLVPIRQAQPGDVVFYQFDADRYADHVGIVESVNKNGVVAIEGNTSVTSDDNGGAVMRRSRRWGLIMAVARPAYGTIREEEEMDMEEVKKLVDQAKKDLEDKLDKALAEAKKERVYTSLEELPWGRETVERLMEAGIITGDERGKLRLTDDTLAVASMVDKLRLELLAELEGRV